MREYKFRGKPFEDVDFDEINVHISKDDFVYGNLIVDGKVAYIVNGIVEVTEEYLQLEQWIPIRPKTVCQFTGLHDKNGVEIYIGDLLGIVDSGYIEPIEVVWDTEFACVCYKQLGDETLPSFEFITKDYEVIGNIHDKGEVK